MLNLFWNFKIKKIIESNFIAQLIIYHDVGTKLSQNFTTVKRVTN